MSRNAGPSTAAKRKASGKRAGPGKQGEGSGTGRVKKEKSYVKNMVRTVDRCNHGYSTGDVEQDEKAQQGESTATAEATFLRRDAGCAAASLGFAMIEIGATYWSLSKWNDRPLNKTVSKAIVKNFYDDGVHSVRPANAIPVIVHRTDIDLTTLVNQDKIPAGLKKIGWRIVPVKVDIANGQHRIDAHLIFTGEQQKDVSDAEKEVAAIERAPASPEQEERLTLARAYLEQKKTYLGSLGGWLGQFYDYGESHHRCASSVADTDMPWDRPADRGAPHTPRDK